MGCNIFIQSCDIVCYLRARDQEQHDARTQEGEFTVKWMGIRRAVLASIVQGTNSIIEQSERYPKWEI